MVSGMRPVTPEEVARWTDLAREHGYADEDGNITAMGRFAVRGVREDPEPILMMETVTPIIAPAYTDELEEKEPPILFDRTDAGEIIIPGRWIASVFEAVRDDASDPKEIATADALASERPRRRAPPRDDGDDRVPRDRAERGSRHLRGAPA